MPEGPLRAPLAGHLARRLYLMSESALEQSVAAWSLARAGAASAPPLAQRTAEEAAWHAQRCARALRDEAWKECDRIFRGAGAGAPMDGSAAPRPGPGPGLPHGE
ncbi:MAG: hypothetical protein ACREPA_10390 [Candidatus Dormibacteraceae bacterium]